MNEPIPRSCRNIFRLCRDEDLDDSSSEDPDATIPYCNHDDSSSEDPDATIPYFTDRPFANWVSQYTSEELRNLQLDDSDLCPILQWIEKARLDGMTSLQDAFL
jgi:hypothetical protein